MEGPPRAVSGRHLPALDGVRALAILGVIAYHLGLGWAAGGYLGVDLFFVLSGFLITSLLLEEWCESARIRLGAFWGGRARRLFPALLIVLIAVSVYAVVNGRFSAPSAGGAAIDLSGLRGDALSTLFYFANWHAIYVHQSYFTQFSTPSPLQHTWSLAIEEQFYLVWPLVIVLLLRWAGRHWRRIGAGLCVVGALASAAAMAALYHVGSDPSRVYYGTDTRAFDLLVGAGLAMLCAGRVQPGQRARSALHVAAPVAVVVLAVFWVTAGTAGLPTALMFRGGFLLCAVLAALVIADARLVEPGPLGRLLALRPLCWIGTISYGLYLWHWPIIVYLNQARTGLSGATLDVARIGLTFAVSTLSYYLVELPIRRRKFSGASLGLLVPGSAAVTALVVILGTTQSVAIVEQSWPGGGLFPGKGPNVVSAGGYGAETPITLPPGLTFSHTHRLRVMTIGDSVMKFAQLGIAAALDSTGVVRVVQRAVPGWGLTSPNALGFLQTLVRRSHPQLVIGTWSWDSAAAKADPVGYQKTLDAGLRTLLTPGDGVDGVILLQMPDLGPLPAVVLLSPVQTKSWSARAAGLSSWNAAVAQAPDAFPGKVMYLPVGGSLEIGGAFTSWLPVGGQTSAPAGSWVRIRTLDGVHLCPPGITRYTAPILEDMTQLFDLPAPRVKWWTSYPIAVEAFNYQDASQGMICPDDHPSLAATHVAGGG